MLVQRIDIPVKMSAQFENLVREASQLLHLELALVQRSEDRAAAGGSQIEREKRILLHLSIGLVLSCSFFAHRPAKRRAAATRPGKDRAKRRYMPHLRRLFSSGDVPADVRIFPFVLR